jgi:hypothetical protein
MFNSSTMIRMVDEIIRDHDLPYRATKIFEAPDKAWTWCTDFVDPRMPEANTFQVCVQWPWGSTYETVKAQLTQLVLEQFRQNRR